MPDIDPATITAVRTWNKPRTKATVTVTIPEDPPYEKAIGGARAARCGYAIVYQRADGSWSVLGLRSEPQGEGNNWHAITVTETWDELKREQRDTVRCTCSTHAAHLASGCTKPRP